MSKQITKYPLSKKLDNQIQIRIDSDTKQKAQKILDNIGLDISSAVKLLLKQVVNTGTMPLEIRDENGFTLKKSRELKQAIIEAKTDSKNFKSVDDLIKNALA